MLKLYHDKNTGIIFTYDLCGYKLKINKNLLEVYYDPWLRKVLEKEFDPDYFRLVAKIIAFLNDETDDDASALLKDLEEMRMIFYNKYEKYLSLSTIKKYLKQINILKNELNLVMYKKKIKGVRTH